MERLNERQQDEMKLNKTVTVLLHKVDFGTRKNYQRQRENLHNNKEEINQENIVVLNV